MNEDRVESWLPGTEKQELFSECRVSVYNDERSQTSG